MHEVEQLLHISEGWSCFLSPIVRSFLHASRNNRIELRQQREETGLGSYCFPLLC